ncbi:hypothetical protein I4U23_002940 [Adineta vaga]|nr:hypothetical protein I4U23_002940 [Adineta vaga]
MLSAIASPIPSNNRRGLHRFYHTGGVDLRMGRPNQEYINRYTFRLQGFILGVLIIFFTSALFSTELGRVYTGSINRGKNDSNGTFQYLINHDVIVGFNGHLLNPKVENRWIWPWSTATLLFSLILFTTGALGILSAVRQSYTTILIFVIGLILSICLVIFLIITYATILAGWKELYGTDRDAMPSFVRIDKDFSSGCLAISCASVVLLFISLIISSRKIQLCTEKNYPIPIRGYERLPINTPRSHPRTPQSPRTPRMGAFRGLDVS